MPPNWYVHLRAPKELKTDESYDLLTEKYSPLQSQTSRAINHISPDLVSAHLKLSKIVRISQFCLMFSYCHSLNSQCHTVSCCTCGARESLCVYLALRPFWFEGYPQPCCSLEQSYVIETEANWEGQRQYIFDMFKAALHLRANVWILVEIMLRMTS